MLLQDPSRDFGVGCNPVLGFQENLAGTPREGENQTGSKKMPNLVHREPWNSLDFDTIPEQNSNSDEPVEDGDPWEGWNDPWEGWAEKVGDDITLLYTRTDFLRQSICEDFWATLENLEEKIAENLEEKLASQQRSLRVEMSNHLGINRQERNLLYENLQNMGTVVTSLKCKVTEMEEKMGQWEKKISE